MSSRRTFLGMAGGMAGAVILGQAAGTRALAQRPFSDYPFALGVASGDPSPDGMVLWTRLAPRPLQGDGGMPATSMPVKWKICADERLSTVVAEGSTFADPGLGHSVHVEVTGLRPDREYFYQFEAGSELSPAGRTRTTPAAGASPRQMSFAFAACQNYPAGHYAAYRHMAEQDLDLVFHLGDYIYEGGGQGSIGRGHLPTHEIRSLADYRIRYGQYKSDPQLQAAHAAFPWVVTMDDHEVENNWADEDSDPDSDPADFLRRRAIAFQAYYEHQPLRLTSMPNGPDMRLHRRLRYGDLAVFNVLDTRQHRSDQACGGGIRERCAEAYDPRRTMTGDAQEQWLLDGLATSDARWNTIAQQTLLAELDEKVGSENVYNMDNWAGYVPARERLLNFIGSRRPSNPVVLTGDIHATFVNDLKNSFSTPDGQTVGTEFACTGISSRKPAHRNESIENALPDNPHIKFYNGRERGYVRCDVSRDEWRADLLFVEDSTKPDSAVRRKASYVIEDGRPGAHPE